MINLISISYGINSAYGYRTPPEKGASSNHKGIDITLKDDKIPAALGGVVTESSYNSSAGYLVKIKATDGTVHMYYHLAEKSNLSVGDTVNEGDIIGIQGSTGISTGKHLHFQVEDEGNPVDPEVYLSTGIKNYDTSSSYYDTNYLSGSDIVSSNYSFFYEEYESVANMSSQPFHAFVELWIGDTHIPPIPPENLISLDVTTLSENSVSDDESAVNVSLTLFDKHSDELEYLFLTNGDNIRLRFGHVSGRQSVILKLAAFQYNINITPAGNIITVQLTSKGSIEASQLVTGSVGDSPSEAVKNICNKVGWSIGRVDDAIQLKGQDGEYLKFNLINDNPIDYIRSVITPRSIRSSDGKGGYQFYLDITTEPNTANFYPIDLEKGGVKTYVYQKGKNSNLIDFNISESLVVSPTVSEYISSGIDPLTKEEFSITSKYSDNKMDSTAPYITFKDTNNSKINVTDNVSKEEISATVSYRFTNDVTLGAATGTATIVGDPTTAPADVIRIIILNDDNSMHSLSGLYHVNGVNHSITNGTMITTMNIHKQGHIEGSVELKSAKIVN